MSSLTPNAVSILVAGNVPEGQHHTAQIINVKRINESRFRVIISDGEHFVQGMLASQLNHMIESNKIVENTVIRVKESITNLVQNKPIVIVLGLDVLHTEPSRIGRPVEIDPDKINNANSQPQAQSMYSQSNKPKPERAMSSPTNNPYGSSRPNQYNRPMSQNQPIVNSSANNSMYTPIASLNMYQNRWTIKARVTTKNPVKEWNNARGQGKLFSVSLLDSSNTDIRATFFKEAVDAFFNMLEEGSVYTFSGGRLKVANQQWNTCKSNFEISFDDKAAISKANDEGNIKSQNFDFVKIGQLEQMEPGANVDLLAVVKSTGIPGTIMSKKSGQELNKCDLVLLDTSGVEISCTIWGEKALKADQEYAGQPIVAFKSLRLGDYGGRSLSSSFNSSIQKDPKELPEVNELRSWWSSTGGAVTKSLSTSSSSRGDTFENRKSISSIKDEQLGFQEKPDWVSMKVNFNFLKKDKEGGPVSSICFYIDLCFPAYFVFINAIFLCFEI